MSNVRGTPESRKDAGRELSIEILTRVVAGSGQPAEGRRDNDALLQLGIAAATPPPASPNPGVPADVKAPEPKAPDIAAKAPDTPSKAPDTITKTPDAPSKAPDAATKVPEPSQDKFSFKGKDQVDAPKAWEKKGEHKFWEKAVDSKPAPDKPEPAKPASSKHDFGVSRETTIATTGVKHLSTELFYGDGTLASKTTVEAKVTGDAGAGFADGKGYLKAGMGIAADFTNEESQRFGDGTHELRTAITAGAKAATGLTASVGADGISLKAKLSGELTARGEVAYVHTLADGHKVSLAAALASTVKAEVAGEATITVEKVTIEGKVGFSATTTLDGTVKYSDATSKSTMAFSGGVQAGAAAGVDGGVDYKEGVLTLKIGVSAAAGLGLTGGVNMAYDTKTQVDAMKAAMADMKDPGSDLSKALAKMDSDMKGQDGDRVAAAMSGAFVAKFGDKLLDEGRKQGGLFGALHQIVGTAHNAAGNLIASSTVAQDIAASPLKLSNAVFKLIQKIV